MEMDAGARYGGTESRDRLNLMDICSKRARCNFSAADASARYGYGFSFYFGITAEGRAHR